MAASSKEYHFPVVGTVTDNRDAEGLGRVRAKCSMIDPQTPLPWAWPVGMPFAGKAQRGAYFPPEIGSTVVIFFVMGDLRYPIYLPGWHGLPATGAELPTSVQGQLGVPPTKKGMESSRWELIWDDTPAATKFQIKDKTRGSLCTFNEDGSVEFKDGNGQFLKMDGAGKLIIGSSSATLIELIEGAAEQLVLGNAFKTLYDAHTHAYIPGTLATTPSAPPLVPMTLGVHTTTKVKTKA